MKRLTGLALAIALPLTMMAQSKTVARFQDQYSGDRDATFISIKGSLFNFFASIADIDDDPEAQALGRIAAGIRSMQVLQVPFFESDLSRTDIEKLKHSLAKEDYEELMSVKDGKEYVHILAQGSASEIRNMLILIEDKNDFTMISINGKLAMEDLAYLSKNHNNWH
jgi:hypothetical protein